jgi:hypothetical protein
MGSSQDLDHHAHAWVALVGESTEGHVATGPVERRVVERRLFRGTCGWRWRDRVEG